MPLYEYECSSHGRFEAFRPVAEAGLSSTCPQCQRSSPRVFSSPMTMAMTPLKRMAAARNEKSRHEPHVCSSGCGHHHVKKAKPAEKPTLTRYTGKRPWVIEHA